MKKILLIILGLGVVGAAAYFMMGKGGSKHLRLIPSDASVVMTFDLKKLADKSDFNGKLKETKLYKKLMEEAKTSKDNDMGRVFSELLLKPGENGLDLGSNMYLFVQGKGEDQNMGVVFGVRDADKFEKFLKGISGMDKRIENKKTYFMFSDERGSCFAWNQNGLLILNRSRGYGDEKKAATVKMFDKLMVQEKEKSIEGNKEYNKYADNQHDIGLYMDYGQLMDMYAEMAGSGNPLLSKMFENYKGIYFSGGANFENDKISFTAKAHGDDKAIEKINYLNKKGVNSQALQYVTNNKVFALISANIDIPKVLAMFDSDNSIKQGMEQSAQGLGLTAKELESLLSGEVVLALVDIVETDAKHFDYQLNEATGQYEMVEKVIKQPMPVLTLNIGVGNKANFDKLMKNIPIQAMDGMRKFPLGFIPMSVYAVETPYGLTLTNDSAFGAGIVQNKKTAKEPDKEIAGMMTDKPAAFYFDLSLNNYPASIPDLLKRSFGEEGYSHFSSYMSIFSNLKGSGDGRESNSELNLVKGEGNSLYRILKQFDTLPIDKLD